VNPITGGAAGSGGATGGPSSSTGGVSGTGSSGNGGTGGGSSECAELDNDYCVTSCVDDIKLVDNASCSRGRWTCAARYVLASSCPPQGCGVALRGCCDVTTGVLTDNPCGMDGLRAVCSEGNRAGDQGWCIPTSLQGDTCTALEGKPCIGPAVNCRDFSLGRTLCACVPGADALSPVWHCSHLI
jgi:hypothetical protein